MYHTLKMIKRIDLMLTVFSTIRKRSLLSMSLSSITGNLFTGNVKKLYALLLTQF